MITQNIVLENTVVVGIDVHKRNHKAVVIDQHFKRLGTYDLDNSEENLTNFITSLKSIAADRQIVIGLEDTGGNGYLLSHYLLTQESFPVFNIPSIYTDRERTLSTHGDKNDILDARRVAEVLITKQDVLNQVQVTERTTQSEILQGLVNDRQDLVKIQTQTKNQIHVLLHREFGDNYKLQSSNKNIFGKKAICSWIVLLKKKETSNAKRIILKLQLLQTIQEQIVGISKELENISKTDRVLSALKEINGCGTVLASQILGEIKDIKRFRNQDKLGKYSGLSPREHSSSKRLKHYTDRKGNRRLNNAIHKVALSQISRMGTGEGKEYYKKKLSEGKSKLHAIRCLKRRLINVIFRKMIQTKE